MIIGVMSDSHDNLPNVRKALRIFQEQMIEAIIHLGDIVSPFTLREICNTGIKFFGVFGNNCGEKNLLLKTISKCDGILTDPPLELEIGQPTRKIILFHGFGPEELTMRIVKGIASTGNYDIVLYGHTHKPHIEHIDNTLVLNPGEVLGYLTGKPTVAVLDVKSKQGRIISIE